MANEEILEKIELGHQAEFFDYKGILHTISYTNGCFFENIQTGGIDIKSGKITPSIASYTLRRYYNYKLTEIRIKNMQCGDKLDSIEFIEEGNMLNGEIFTSEILQSDLNYRVIAKSGKCARFSIQRDGVYFRGIR